MPGASWSHQKVVYRVAKAFERYQEATGKGEFLLAPFDVLIRRFPKLQTRQPDVFYITSEALARGGGISEKGPLEVAPELVVEVISESESEREIAEKLQDYTEIGVQEAWLLRRPTRTIEVLHLTSQGPILVATYDETQILQSFLFSDLHISVAELFQM